MQLATKMHLISLINIQKTYLPWIPKLLYVASNVKFLWSALVEWPFGTYTLVKPKSGCPSGWQEGWRRQDSEDGRNRNSLSFGHHFYGTLLVVTTLNPQNSLSSLLGKIGLLYWNIRKKVIFFHIVFHFHLAITTKLSYCYS